VNRRGDLQWRNGGQARSIKALDGGKGRRCRLSEKMEAIDEAMKPKHVDKRKLRK
jgi:hypothetical protein